MRFILLLLTLYISTLSATSYPKTYSTIGNQLYKPMETIEHNSRVKALRSMSLNYIKFANNTMHLGFSIDKDKNRENTKSYLAKLRELEKAQAYILRSTREQITLAINTDNSKLFFLLTDKELPNLLKPKDFRRRVWHYEETHKKQRTSLAKSPKKEPAKVIKKEKVTPKTIVKKPVIIPKKTLAKKVVPKTKVNPITPIKEEKIPQEKISSKQLTPFLIEAENIENLGNPYSKYYPDGESIYARNIWDMHSYKNLLFLGAGNSNNIGPATNAGPVAVMTFNPKNSSFNSEGKISEEQINIFRTINNELYIPGHDATQHKSYANFYKRRSSGGFERFRNIPSSLNLHDITRFDSKLFVAIGLNNEKAGIGISNDNGKSWDISISGNSYAKLHSFIKVNDSLFATKTFTPLSLRNSWINKRKINYFSVSEYGINEKFFPRSDLNEQVMFAKSDLEESEIKKITHTQSFDNKAMYIGSYIRSDFQNENFGVYLTTSLEYSEVNIKPIILEEDSIPYDIIIKKNYIYILTYNHAKEEISVFRALRKSPQKFKKLLYFSSSTFARSFERINSDFYFGLGCQVSDANHFDIAELDDQCGDILRVHYKDI